MIWILIVIRVGSSNAFSINQEFNTEPACQVASSMIKRQSNLSLDVNLCVPKGKL